MDKAKLARDYYEQGRQALAEAKSSAYRDNQHIVEAEHNFKQATEHNPQLLAAILGMAYVKALQGFKTTAQTYLTQAEKIAPQDAKLHQLKQDIDRLEDEEPFSELPALALYLESISFYPQRVSHMQNMDLDYAPYMHFLKKK